MMTWADFLRDEPSERLSRVNGTATLLSVALHVAVILPFVELPLPSPETGDPVIDVTLELAPPPLGQPLLLPEPTPADPPSREEFLRSQPAVAMAAPSPAPTLEQQLTPVDAPPAVEGQEFAEAKPEPATLPEAPPVQALAPPPVPPAAKPQPPKPRAVQEAMRQDAPGATTRPVAAAPGNGLAQRQAAEDYFRLIVQKISRYHFLSRGQSTTDRGLVVTRLTLARDGGVLDVSLLRSSGSPALDNAVVQTIRSASPFPPLPADLAGGGPQTFVVPVNYSRDR
jgi:protein TonB